DGGVRGAALEALHRCAAVVQQHEDDGRRGRGGGTPTPGRCGERPAPGSLDERRAAGGAELGPRRDRRPAAPTARARAGSGETPAAMRAERQQAAGTAATEMTRERLGAGPAYGRRRDRPRPWHCADRGRLDAGGLAHGFPAVHTELRSGVVFAAAVGADGHWRKCSTGRKSTTCPIYWAN